MTGIAIVGAGISGLLVAERLVRRGHHCTVFEKSRGLGGRTARRRLPWGQIDIGAPIFTPASPAARALLDTFASADLLTKTQLSAGQLQGGQVTSTGTRLAYLAQPTNNQLCHHLGQGLTIHLSRRISSISSVASRVTLADESGDRHAPFSAVLVSAPAPQAAALLPPASSLLKQVWPTLEPRWTVTLQLAGALDIFAGLDVIDIKDSGLARIVALSQLPGRQAPHCYQIELGASLSRHCKELQENEIVDLVEAELARYTRPPLRQQVTLQRWNLARLPEGSSRDLIVADDAQRIVLCGDWTAAGDAIDGAIRSADRAEDALLDLLN